MRPAVLLLLLLSSAAPAAPQDAIARARHDLEVAQSLDRRGLRFSAFFHYAAVLQSGVSGPPFLEAAAGAAAAAEDLGDGTIAPNLFDRLPPGELAALPPQPLGRIRSWLALLAFRAGRSGDAERLAALVPPENRSFPEAQYVAGLARQRVDPEKAANTFRAITSMPGAGQDLRELAWLALGRTLYGQHRYAEASAAYGMLPRFSRHWDEALLEGAWSDLRNGDPGGALGKLHSLHSPHLKDEFVPESVNLAAILFQQRCLYPRVRAALEQFDSEYAPMRDQMKKALRESAVEEYWRMLEPGDPRLPPAARQHLAKNERVASMVSYLGRLAREEARIRGDSAPAGGPPREELLDAIAQQQALVRRLGGKFVQGRLADMVRLIDVLDTDRELIAFEATKGEKEMLENRFDPEAQLASQKLARPPMPQAGHEYWPFDGEYWPDEIGYYRYTVKDACPRSDPR